MKNFFFFVLLLISLNVQAQSPVTFTGFDLNPGAGDSNPLNYIELNGKFYFDAADAQNGRELWESDGTVNGTKMLIDINPGTPGSSPSYFMTLNNKIYFSASDTAGYGLWVSDGTAAGTQKIKDIRSFWGIAFNGKLIFIGKEAVNGVELWITDGTPAGTGLLQDITPGTSSSGIYGFNAFNGKIYFIGNGNLWTTNGTPAGTVMVKDVDPGKPKLGLDILHVTAGKMYLAAYTQNEGEELWISDGTTAGTHILVDLNPGIDDGLTVGGMNGTLDWGVAEYNGLIYFNGLDKASNSGSELWVTDGTVAGTKLAVDIAPGKNNGSPKNFKVSGGYLYFTANDGTHGEELWITDGTAAGTRMVKDISATNAQPFYLTEYNGNLYFIAYQSGGDRELYRTDGTTQGTVLLSPAPTHTYSIKNNSRLFVSNSKLFFCAEYDGNGEELWSLEDVPSAIINTNPCDNFTIAPNPGSGNFVLKMNNALSFTSGTLTVYDVTGKSVLTQPVQKNEKTVQLALTGITKGIYIVQLRSDNNVTVQRLVIE